MTSLVGQSEYAPAVGCREIFSFTGEKKSRLFNVLRFICKQAFLLKSLFGVEFDSHKYYIGFN
jgi:hypothetical protein